MEFGIFQQLGFFVLFVKTSERICSYEKHQDIEICMRLRRFVSKC